MSLGRRDAGRYPGATAKKRCTTLVQSMQATVDRLLPCCTLYPEPAEEIHARFKPVTDNTSPDRRVYVVGIVLLFAAAILWSLNGALIKLIDDRGRGPHAVTIAFYRSLVAGLLLLPVARGKIHTLRSRRHAPRTTGTLTPTFSPPLDRPGASAGILDTLLSLRPAALSCVVFFTIMTACFILANVKTEAANAIILQYTSTFWIFGLSPWLLGEKPRTKDLWILGIAMAGIAVIFAGNAATDLTGLALALASGLFYALLTMMIRRMRDSDSAAVTVLNNLGSALLLLPVVLLVGGLAVSTRSLLLLVFMGVVQFGFPYYLYALGLARVPAHQAVLMTLLEPVLVPVWTYLAVGEEVPPTTFIGGGVILMAMVLFVRSASRSNETKR